MKQPRSHQRMPTGGRRLYEALRSDFEPVLIDVFIAEDTPNKDRLKDGTSTLSFSREFDPMLYFWPVEAQHVVVHLWQEEPHLVERLGKALLRDGALWVSFLQGALSYTIETRGDADAFWRRRYGVDCPVGAVATPAGGG